MKAELSFVGRTPMGAQRFWKAGSQAFTAPWPREQRWRSITTVIVLGAHGGLLIPKDSKAGKEYSAFVGKLYKKDGGMTPVRMHNGIYLMDFWIAPGSKEGSDSCGGPPNRV